MLRKMLYFLMAITFWVSSSLASLTVDVDGVRFDTSVHAMAQRLHLTGAGVLRYLVFIKAYAGALYLPASVAAEDALEAVPKRLMLSYFRAIKGEDFAKATRKKIADNVTAGQAKRLESRVDLLAEMYRDVQPGDRYALTYLPGEGTELALNGERLGIIPGDDFARALFSIWLGEEPFDGKLKRQLLDRS